MRIQTRGPSANVKIHDAVFLRRQVIDIQLGRDLNTPVGGTKRCVAVKQVERKRYVFTDEELPEASKKLGFAGTGRSQAARHRQTPPVRKCIAGG
jgi:hypothetical protein